MTELLQQLLQLLLRDSRVVRCSALGTENLSSDLPLLVEWPLLPLLPLLLVRFKNACADGPLQRRSQ